MPPVVNVEPTNIHCNMQTAGVTWHLNHSIFSKGQWHKSQFLNHPKVQLQLSVVASDYRAFHHHCPTITPKHITALADSGAQSCLWSMNNFLAVGFQKSDLLPVSVDLVAANKSPITIEGAILLRLQGKSPDGTKHSCPTMVYVSKQARGFYLSMEAMMDLSIISHMFPTVGAASIPPAVCSPLLRQVISRILNAGCSALPTEDASQCSCPIRTVVPDPSKGSAFEGIPENNERMEKCLLQYFASSTFNTCPHRPFPHMTGPPAEIHLEDDAIPKAVTTPATVPIHWQKQVEADILRDEPLGVLEKVPYGEPVTWCHRMVIQRKHDGTPVGRSIYHLLIYIVREKRLLMDNVGPTATLHNDNFLHVMYHLQRSFLEDQSGMLFPS